MAIGPVRTARYAGIETVSSKGHESLTIGRNLIQSVRHIHLAILADSDDNQETRERVSSMGTIAVSGSGSGIGAATRQILEQGGDTVIGIDLANAEIIADLSTDEGRAAAVAQTLESCGGQLDGLVTGAGVGPPVAANLITEVNYFGSVALLEGLRPALAASGQAQVVQIGSNSTTLTPNLPDELVDAFLGADRSTIAAILDEAGTPFDTMISYGASKTAVTRWCRRQAITDDWVGQGIRLNVIAPGAVQTPLLQGGDDDPVIGPLTTQLPIPAGRGTPEEIAAWITFMLSPAARFACGSVVFVDGGSDAVIRTDDWPRTFSA